MKKVIVTGANGFIGTALCKELVSQNIQVVAVVRSREANVDGIINLPNLTIVYCDLSRFGDLGNIINDKNFDVLYHLAWEGSAGSLRGDIDVQ